ncbi:hypothetical protein DE171_000037 [Clostridium beijerinckii]|nr:hypothetical protein [Clostridium beijerinckii]
MQKTSNDIDVNDFNLEDSAYEDAFDHIEYLDEISLDDDLILDEMTEEVYPGVRRLKKSIE